MNWFPLVVAWVWFPALVWGIIYLLLPHTTFEMDVNRQQWSFLFIYDRYATWYRQLSTVALILGVSCWWLSRETAACMLVAASVYALLFQIATLNFYENYVHRAYPREPVNGSVALGPSSYTSFRYSIVTTLGIVPILLFAIGLVAALVQGVRPR